MFIYCSYQFDLGWCHQSQDKVTFFGNPHFLLHIFVTNLESFSEHYNDTSFD